MNFDEHPTQWQEGFREGHKEGIVKGFNDGKEWHRRNTEDLVFNGRVYRILFWALLFASMVFLVLDAVV